MLREKLAKLQVAPIEQRNVIAVAILIIAHAVAASNLTIIISTALPSTTGVRPVTIRHVRHGSESLALRTV